ncbi:MAG: lysophospholipid acyltransferase family protein [Chitinispirillaceae bacterium]
MLSDYSECILHHYLYSRIDQRISALNFASFFIWLIGSLLGKTWRKEIISPPSVDIFNPEADSTVYAFWHSRLLVSSFVFRKTGKSAVVSSSKDGRMAADVAMKWGHEIIYGSSSRGGLAALRQCVKVLKNRGSIAITPDGPRGPREVVKPGVAQISIMSGAPVVPISVNCSRAWHLKSWDRFLIPTPFSKVTITLGEPIYPPAELTEEAVDHLVKNIQNGLS